MKNKKWKQFEKLTDQCYMDMIGSDKDGICWEKAFELLMEIVREERQKEPNCFQEVYMLDEATAAAEAATMMYGLRSRDQQKKSTNVLFVDESIFPQNLAVIQTRVIPQGMKIQVGNYKELEFTPEIFACIIQYPNASGSFSAFAAEISSSSLARMLPSSRYPVCQPTSSPRWL